MRPVYRPPVCAYPIAVASRLFALPTTVVISLAYGLEPVVVTPEQLRIATVRDLVIDYLCPWVGASCYQATAADLAGVVIPEQDALACSLPPGCVV